MDINSFVIKIIDFLNPVKIFCWIIMKIYSISKLQNSIHIQLTEGTPVAFHLNSEVPTVWLRFEIINGAPLSIEWNEIFLHTLGFGSLTLITDQIFKSGFLVNASASKSIFWRLTLTENQRRAVSVALERDKNARVFVEGKTDFYTKLYGRFSIDFRIQNIIAEVNI